MKIIIKDRFHFTMRSHWFAAMMIGLFLSIALTFFLCWASLRLPKFDPSRYAAFQGGL